jgi:hypothetical protein
VGAFGALSIHYWTVTVLPFPLLLQLIELHFVGQHLGKKSPKHGKKGTKSVLGISTIFSDSDLKYIEKFK